MDEMQVASLNCQGGRHVFAVYFSYRHEALMEAVLSSVAGSKNP